MRNPEEELKRRDLVCAVTLTKRSKDVMVFLRKTDQFTFLAEIARSIQTFEV